MALCESAASCSWDTLNTLLSNYSDSCHTQTQMQAEQQTVDTSCYCAQTLATSSLNSPLPALCDSRLSHPKRQIKMTKYKRGPTESAQIAGLVNYYSQIK